MNKQYFLEQQQLLACLDKRQSLKVISHSKPFNQTLFDVDDQISYVLKLAKCDQLVLTSYTGDMALEINPALRQNSLSDPNKADVDAIDSIFRGCPPTVKPLVIYRGLTAIQPSDFVSNDLGGCFVHTRSRKGI